MAELEPERLAVASLNHPEANAVLGDLRFTWGDVIRDYRATAGGERLTLLAACPPCQGMSTARGQRGRDTDVEAGGRDPRNLLVVPIAEVARALHPRVIVVENVQAFLTRQVPHPETKEGISAASLLVQLLKAEYAVFPVVVDLCHFGVPQSRIRSFMTFVARDEPALVELHTRGLTPYPVPSHDPCVGGMEPITLAQALVTFGLPMLDAATPETAQYPLRPLHSVPVWDADRHAMVAAIPAGSGLSAWDNDLCGVCGPTDVGANDALCPVCEGPLLRPVVMGEEGVRLIKGFRNSSYRRMALHRPAATVTTASNRVGSDNTIHPTENRVLSIFECQLLQTIPADFVWGEELVRHSSSRIREMIGEAVPPHFTHLHGEAIVRCLRAEFDDLLPAGDLRSSKANGKLFGRSTIELPR
jgi:DNA (cytosine-5)-methyltransferase 1